MNTYLGTAAPQLYSSTVKLGGVLAGLLRLRSRSMSEATLAGSFFFLLSYYSAG